MRINVIDVRSIEPIERYEVIFKAFDDLQLNECFELVNDHDLKPLLRYFESEKRNEFSWDYLEKSDLFRVKIGRIAMPDPEDSGESCCGMCKG